VVDLSSDFPTDEAPLAHVKILRASSCDIPPHWPRRDRYHLSRKDQQDGTGRLVATSPRYGRDSSTKGLHLVRRAVARPFVGGDRARDLLRMLPH
jgi:hypothetical protein